MTRPPLPEQFLSRFVKRGMRERVAHEWVKKPVRLETRICHHMETLFDEKYRGVEIPLDPESRVFVLRGEDQSIRVAEVEGIGSGSLLLVAEDGSWFFAETELMYQVPVVVWSGRI
ncbi:MAG: hypothetical protein ACIAQF_10920 [Phycisphaerales bacterium JB065]